MPVFKILVNDMDSSAIDAALDFLAKDEQEAINGYDAKIAELSKDPNLKSLTIQLESIKKEKQTHLAFLIAAKKDKASTYKK